MKPCIELLQQQTLQIKEMNCIYALSCNQRNQEKDKPGSKENNPIEA